MSSQIRASELFVGSENLNLLIELDNQIAEVICAGQSGPNVYYGCPRDRFVINYNGYDWYRGARGCRTYGQNEVPPEVRQAAQQ
jgi:hypothetical protein